LATPIGKPGFAYWEDIDGKACLAAVQPDGVASYFARRLCSAPVLILVLRGYVECHTLTAVTTSTLAMLTVLEFGAYCLMEAEGTGRDHVPGRQVRSKCGNRVFGAILSPASGECPMPAFSR
jgi:hypothetical protein